MISLKLNELTAHELHEKLVEKEVSATEITKSVYERIDAVEEKVNSYVTLTKEQAIAQADKIDQRIKNGETITPLMGIPIAIKDNMCTDGVKTTCSSKMLADFVSPYNATVMNKLNESGTVMVGKTNLDEFAMGGSTETSYFGTTHNPWDLERVPGGSSGGSAAAIAADEAIISLGSDTGGSIRQPASFCGIVGLKPTYGRVSRYGLVAFASSLDQIGPITKDVTDAALVMNAISGHDGMDSTSANVEVPDFTKALIPDVKGMKIGVPKEYLGEGIDQEVADNIRQSIKRFEAMGAKCEEISLPHTEYAVSVYYIIAPAEASSNLARFDGVRYTYRAEDANDLMELYCKSRSQGFGPEVKRRIMIGTYALSSGYYDAYYKKAQQVRTLIKEDFEKAFQTYDVILSPTSPSAAFKIGEKASDPLSMYLSDICTIPVNLAGIPSISIPGGYNAAGMPMGIQLMGKAFAENTILRAAYAFEQNIKDMLKRAPLKG